MQNSSDQDFGGPGRPGSTDRGQLAAESPLEALRAALDGPAVERLAAATGIDPAQAGRAALAVAATVLAGAAHRAGSLDGAGTLLGILRDDPRGGATAADAPGSLAATFNDPAARDALIRRGSGLAGQLLGSKQGPILDALAAGLNIGRSALGPLLGLIAPLVLDRLGALVRARGLTPEGLQELLRTQAVALAPELPAGLSKAIEVEPPAVGLGAVSGSSPEAAELARRAAAYGAAGAVEPPPSSVRAAPEAPARLKGGYFVPLLGVTALALVGVVFTLNSCNRPDASGLSRGEKTDTAVTVDEPGRASAPPETSPLAPDVRTERNEAPDGLERTPGSSNPEGGQPPVQPLNTDVRDTSSTTAGPEVKTP